MHTQPLVPIHISTKSRNGRYQDIKDQQLNKREHFTRLWYTKVPVFYVNKLKFYQKVFY